MYGGSLNSVTWIPASARASWSAAPVTSWDVTSVSSSSIHKTCCHCNKNIDVLITAAVGGSHFRLRFNGANTYYLLHSITVAKEGSYTAPNHDASTQVGVSVGAIGGTSQITIAAHSQVWTDWITYDVQVRLPFLRLTSVQPPCRSDHSCINGPSPRPTLGTSFPSSTSAGPTTTASGRRAARARGSTAPLGTTSTTSIAWRCSE